MDRPRPGGWFPFPPTGPSRQPPPRRWKFARLISSSHPHSGRVLFASLAVGRLLDPGTLAPSLTGLCAVRCAVCHSTCRMSSLDRAASIEKASVSPASCSHDTRQLHEHVSSTYGHNREEMIRLKVLEGVPSRSHSTSDTHADSGRAMPIAECTQRRGAGSQTLSRVSTARGAFLIREKASSRVLPQTGLADHREIRKPKPVIVCPVDDDDDVDVVVAAAAA